MPQLDATATRLPTTTVGRYAGPGAVSEPWIRF